MRFDAADPRQCSIDGKVMFHSILLVEKDIAGKLPGILGSICDCVRIV